jgi:hypothetical protein
LELVSHAPVTRPNWTAVGIHCPHRQYRSESSRNMEAFAAVVARRSDNENVVLSAQTDGIGQQVARFSRSGQLTAADVDYVGALLNCLRNRSCEVHLGTRGEPYISPISKNGYDQPSTMRCDASNRTTVLTKDNAGNMSAMLGGITAIRNTRNQGGKPSKISSVKAGVRLVNGSVEYGHTYARNTKGLGPE